MQLRERLKPYKKEYPKSTRYILRNIVKDKRCSRCGNPLLKETSVQSYPYQCMSCDENMYSFETIQNNKSITDDELDKLVENTVDLLLLDD